MSNNANYDSERILISQPFANEFSINHEPLNGQAAAMRMTDGIDRANKIAIVCRSVVFKQL